MYVKPIKHCSRSSINPKTHYTFQLSINQTIEFKGEGILLLMDEMKWKKAFLISTEGGDYGELGRGVRDVSDTETRLLDDVIGSHSSDTCCLSVTVTFVRLET